MYGNSDIWWWIVHTHIPNLVSKCLHGKRTGSSQFGSVAFVKVIYMRLCTWVKFFIEHPIRWISSNNIGLYGFIQIKLDFSLSNSIEIHLNFFNLLGKHGCKYLDCIHYKHIGPISHSPSKCVNEMCNRHKARHGTARHGKCKSYRKHFAVLRRIGDFWGKREQGSSVCDVHAFNYYRILIL